MTTTITKMDEVVRDRVLRELEWDPEFDASEIGVTADGEVVTLTGFVDTYAAKLAAERAAERVVGVRAVANGLQVRLRLERPDPDIAKDALAALRSRISIPATVQATVRNGHVSLHGEVEWMYQKAAAEAAVKDLPGLKGIDNYIQIVPTGLASDVKGRIEDALARNAQVDARRIRVEADGGTVSLHGFVRSWVEKRQVEDAAWSAPGVSDVKSHLIMTL
jgi:osmotically-inducible protein OsmY